MRGENDSKHICPQFVCSYNTKPQAWPCTNLSPLGKPACGNVSRPWVFNTRTHRSSLSPRGDSNVCQGHTSIDGSGTSKQVAQECESLRAASSAIVWSLCASQRIKRQHFYRDSPDGLPELTCSGCFDSSLFIYLKWDLKEKKTLLIWILVLILSYPNQPGDRQRERRTKRWTERDRHRDERESSVMLCLV